MADLQVHVSDNSGRIQAVVAGHIIDAVHREIVRTFTATVGQTATVPIDPGEYIVSVAMPTGATLAEDVAVNSDRPATVAFSLPSSAHEWLAWSRFTGDVDRVQRYEEERRQLVPPVPIWHRLWRWWPWMTSWEVVPWPQGWMDSDSTSWAYHFQVQGGRTLLQLGGTGVAWRCTMLPPTDSVDVVIRPSENDELSERGARVTVVGSDHASEGLLHYLMGGATESARVIGDELTAHAEEMLHDKIENPMGAAVGGYYLLHARAWDRMHNWPSNFVRFIDWLPDAAVIQGLQLLEDPAQRDYAGARGALLEAVRRGVPVFTVGLRRLHDALVRLLQVEPDTAVATALETIQRYTDAADWSQPYTTFYGFHPTRPSIGSTVGVPLDWRGIEFLPDSDTFAFGGSFPPTTTYPSSPVARRNVHVIAGGDGWRVETLAVGNVAAPPAVGPFPAREQALDAASSLTADTWARLIVHLEDGSTESVRHFNPSWWSGPGVQEG